MATTISGVVVNDAGAPVSGASVMIARAPVATPDIAQVTSADGAFAIDAPLPGEYELLVRGAGGATGRLIVEVGDDAPDPLVVGLHPSAETD